MRGCHSMGCEFGRRVVANRQQPVVVPKVPPLDAKAANPASRLPRRPTA